MGNHVVTGVGPDGRSKVISVSDRATMAFAGFGEVGETDSIMPEKAEAKLSVAMLYKSDDPAVTERPATGHLLPVQFPPHGAIWLETKYEGFYETEHHRTDTIDFQYIAEGEIELILEDGSVTLRAGDSVVVPGIIHRWRSEKLCRSIVFAVGIDPA